jgi:acyl-CoA dehydrogenase
MTTPYRQARTDLAAWRRAADTAAFAVDDALQALIDASVADDARRHALDSRAHAFAAQLGRDVAPLVARYEQRGHGPELARWDGVGRRIERVDFDGAYHDAGARIWASGLVTDSGTPGRAFEQATLLYLLSLEGEAGHACPAVCTIGMARALRRRAGDDVRARFLPPLLEGARASQFLTEVQGGSDVGANATRADLVADGTYRIWGEKWFCSVADADAFLVTARVGGDAHGTRGLGCFAVPRLVDGAPNGFTIRRLKDKLGTRSMASGEIDFDGAVALPIGAVEDGFKTAAGVVLNTSRWLTAVGAAGIMRRAVVEARAYARHRSAFGQPIDTFPLVRRTLASMTCEWLAGLHLSWMVTDLEDAIDGERATDEEVAFHRFLVNVAKYAASSAASHVVRDAIEVLGGNGTIEDFSVLPRLYRDAIVYESWEGTHNVITQQVLRDCERLGLLDVVAARLQGVDQAKPVLVDAHRALEDPAWGGLHFRRVLDRLARVLAIASLRAHGRDAVADYLSADEDDPGLAGKIDAVLTA